MSKVIYLIPLANNVIVTKIILGLIYAAKQNNKKVVFFKPIDIFVLNKKKVNYVDAGVIIKEQNLSSIIESNIIEDISYFYKESNYSNLIESVVDKYYQNQQLYDVFIIEGITVKFTTDIEYRFNIDIAKSLNAEIIFSGIFNNKLDTFCINHIRNILSKCVLDFSSSNKISLILNKVNSSQIIQNKNYFGINFEILGICHSLTLLSKKLVEDVSNFNLISVIGCIPWNKRFCRIPIIKIVDYFKKEIVYLGKVFNQSIQCYDVFDQQSTNVIKKINEDSLIFVPCERLDLLKIIYIAISKGIKIKAIILTGQVTSLIHSSFAKIFCKIALFKVTIFSTNTSTLSTVFQLKKICLIALDDDFKKIDILQKYIYNFFDTQWMKRLFFSKTLRVFNTCFNFKSTIKFLACSANKSIVLPESTEPRILQAVSVCTRLGIAQCVLLGKVNYINELALKLGISFGKGVKVIDPDLIRKDYISCLVQKRALQGMNEKLAKISLQDNMLLSTLMLDNGEVDGIVSGVVNTTANTIRPALQIIKSKNNFSLVSSVFFMLLPDHVLIYADCALNILPTVRQLAEIAIQSADTARSFGIRPKIAMISYATGNSASGSSVNQVQEATLIVKKIRPDLIIDGPIQYDAAIDENIGNMKSPNSCLHGKANVFIFPDLNTGNTVYKAVQRSCNIIAIGPVLQGLNKPVNDLSRGSSVEDIVYTIAITAIQSIHSK